MIIGLLLVQLALCVGILHREVVQLRFRHFASSLFFVVYTILYVIVPMVLHLVFDGATSIVAGSTTKFEDRYVYYLFNAYGIALLSVFLLFGRIRTVPTPGDASPTPATAPETPPESEQDTDHRRQASSAALMIIAGFLMFMYATGMGFIDLLYATRFAWFGESTLSLFWLTVSAYLLALSGIFAYHVRVGTSRNHLLNLACLAAIVLTGIMTKDRKWVIFLASGWLAGSYEREGRRLAIGRNGALALALLFCILLISQFIRDVLVRVAFGQEIVLADEVARWSSFLIEYGDISYFYRASLEAIHQNLNNDFIVWFALPRRILLFFLPTGLSSGLKPEDISAIFSDVVDGGDTLRRGNMPPGLFGLFVISFGWLASLFVIPTLAVLLKRLDVLFSAGTGMVRRVLLALYTFAVVLAFRGDDSSAVYFVISTLLLMGAADRLRPGRRVPAQRSVELVHVSTRMR